MGQNHKDMEIMIEKINARMPKLGDLTTELTVVPEEEKRTHREGLVKKETGEENFSELKTWVLT